MGALEPLTLVVTGAAGFIGRRVVLEARARGHRVRAVVRPGGPLPVWDDGVQVHPVDLAGPGAAAALGPVLAGADVVVHAAATLSGDAAAQAALTLGGTRALCEALRAAPAANLVLISSLAVYGVRGLRAGDLLTEDTPLARDPSALDAYARAKLEQEAIARAVRPDLTILRPGAVFGPGRLWNAHIGIGLGPAVLQLGRAGQVPLSHVDHCAAAIVLAAEHRACSAGSMVINVVDDDLPDRARFLRALARDGWPRVVLPGDWRLLLVVARGLAALGLGARLPGLLRPGILRARMLPLRYSNDRLHRVLGWQPRAGFEATMAHAIKAGKEAADG